MLPKMGPISLLNTIPKIYKHLLLYKLQIHTMPLIRLEQFGFRVQYSTTSLLINIVDDISNSLYRRFKTAVALLNEEKAFNKVFMTD